MLVALAAETTLDDSEVRLEVPALSTLLAALLALSRMLLVPELALATALDADARMEDAEADADEPIAEASLRALETEETRDDCSLKAEAVLIWLFWEI